MTVNNTIKLTRQFFPGATVAFATDGTRVIGSPAMDDPKPIPYAQAPDRPTDRATQAGLQAMRDTVAGADRKRP
jgi:hypothetical protein